MALPTVDTWTGTNGAAWPAQWTTQTGSSGFTVDILSNRGRLVTGTLGGYGDYVYGSMAVGGSGNFDLRVDVRFTTVTEAYVQLYFRDDFADSRFLLRFDAGSGSVPLYRIDSGTPTSLGSGTFSNTVNNLYHVRVLAEGSSIKCRWWLDGGSEPSTWDIEVTDTAHTDHTGLALSLGGPAAASSVTVEYDNLSIVAAAEYGLVVGSSGAHVGSSYIGSSDVASATVSAQAASGTGTANNASTASTVTAGTASGTGTAYVASVTETTNAQDSSGTGTAYNATVTIVPATNALAEVATGTGTAYVGSVTATVNAEISTGTGTANNPSTATAVSAQAATGTGTAYNATVTIVPATNAQAEVATGIGTAYAATVAVTTSAGVATGTGTAYAAALTSTVFAQPTSGTGTAYSATVAVMSLAQPALGGSPFNVLSLSPALWIDPSVASSVTLSGSSGAYIGPNGLVLPGGSNAAQTPDAAILDLTGDLEIIVKATAGDWTPAVRMALVVKGSAASAAADAYCLRLETSGVLSLSTTNGVSYFDSSSTVATGLTNGTAKWIKATYDATNGANSVTEFFLSDDGSSWTQLGTTVNGTPHAGIPNVSSPLHIGIYNTVQPWIGTIHRAIVKNGIGGTTVFDADFVTAADYATTFTESSTNAATVTITATNTPSAAAGALVSQINDLSGNARHLTQGTAANMPRYWNGCNGLNCLVGGDATDKLNAATTADWNFLHNGTVWLLGATWRPRTASASERFLIGNNANESAVRGFALYGTTVANQLILTMSNGAAKILTQTVSGGITDNAWGVNTVLADPSNATASARASMYLNGGAANTSNALTGTPSALDAAGPIAVMGGRAYNFGPVGITGEIVIASGANATEANRTSLRDYQNTKWAVYSVSSGASDSVKPNAGLASATGTAYDTTVATKVNAGLSSATGTAYEASTGTQVTAGTSSGTGTAYNATVTTSVTVSAEVATGSVTAYGATTATTANAGTVSGTGSAYNAYVSTAVIALLANASGVSYDAGGSIAPLVPAVGTGSGAAYGMASAVSVYAGCATATGTALLTAIAPPKIPELYVYNGSSFVQMLGSYVYNGSTWVDANGVASHNGSTWVQS